MTSLGRRALMESSLSLQEFMDRERLTEAERRALLDELIPNRRERGQPRGVAPVFSPLPVPAPLDNARAARAEPRVCIVTCDIEPATGHARGSAYTSLALALSAAGLQVSILDVSLDGRSGRTPESLRARYGQLGIRFELLPEIDVVFFQSRGNAVSYQIYSWLKKADFDVVHFPDRMGLGYYSLLAKRQGLAFEHTHFCVGAHGGTAWDRERNQGLTVSLLDLEAELREQKCVELADTVISPSQYYLGWMHEQGWKLPPRAHVQHGISSAAARQLLSSRARASRSGPIAECVFYGPLDLGSGLDVFCSALDRLNASGRRGFAVTFLGRPAEFMAVHPGTSAYERFDSSAYIRERARDWNFAHTLITDFDRAQALSYLVEKEGRLAICPSLEDNGPDTVLDCLDLGIPMIAADVAGVRELVRESDRAAVLFPPRPAQLAGCLAAAFQRGVQIAQASYDRRAYEHHWVEWHRGIERAPETSSHRARGSASARAPLVSVCVPHRNRPQLLNLALGSLEQQTYENFEVIVVDDGSDLPEVEGFLVALEKQLASRGWRLIRQENRFPGAARNTAVVHARGEYLLFLDDDNLAKPQAIETFVAVAERTGADVLTCPLDFFAGEPPSEDYHPIARWTPLGVSAAGMGALLNCFGDTNMLIKREAFFLAGGFTEDPGLGWEDHEFLSNAALAGLHLEVVVESLVWYRKPTGGNVSASSSPAASLRRILRPHFRTLPLGYHPLLRFAQGAAVGQYASLREGGGSRAELDAVKRNFMGEPVPKSSPQTPQSPL